MDCILSESPQDGLICIDAGYIRPGLACFYLLQGGDEFAVVETGTSRSLASLKRVMQERGVAPEQVRYVMPTHVHLDHAGGAGVMMDYLPAARLVIHPRGAAHMADPARLADSARAVYGDARFRELYGEIRPVPPGRMEIAEDCAVFRLGDRRLELRHTRGHANHHYCIWDEASRGWFSGDSFGISYPWFRFPAGDFLLPTTTPTQFEPEALLQTFALLDSYCPRRIFLTHAGELDYSDRLVPLLSRQVEEYCRLAPLYAGDVAGLRGALAAYTLELIQALDPGADERSLRDMLAFDADLNAQGLIVWQRRLADAANAGPTPS